MLPIQLPEGYHIEYGGQFESEQAASRTLLLTSLMSLLVIFLLLYNEFKNAKESGVILLNLPLALIGGVFILKLTSGEVSIPAIIGFISLFGIATRNGMLADQPLHASSDCRECTVETSRPARFYGPFESYPDDGAQFGSRVNPACAERRFARQRDTKSDGDRYLRRSADIHFPERLHHPDCLFINE